MTGLYTQVHLLLNKTKMNLNKMTLIYRIISLPFNFCNSPHYLMLLGCTQAFVSSWPHAHLLFWYQVLTCVSVRFRDAASSILSCTLRYFWRSKLRSSWASWWSVKAVRAFRGFFRRTCGLSLLLEISLSPSSFTETSHWTKGHWLAWIS